MATDAEEAAPLLRAVPRALEACEGGRGVGEAGPLAVLGTSDGVAAS